MVDIIRNFILSYYDGAEIPWMSELIEICTGCTKLSDIILTILCDRIPSLIKVINDGNENTLDNKTLLWLGIRTIDKIDGQSLKYFNMALEKNNMDALYCLAWFYDNTLNSEKDSREYLARGEKLGDSKILHFLGVNCAHNGKIEKAVEYYTRAAEKGAIRSLHNLGNLFYEKDLEKAKTFYERASLLGCIDSCRKLGDIYFDTDKEKAEKYYQIVAEKGSPRSLHKLGGMYQKKDNNEKAIECYKRSSQLGYIKSHSKLGNIYFDTDKEEAIKYYKLAEENGDISACHQLGRLFYTHANYTDAKKKFKATILHAKWKGLHEVALYNLGLSYLQNENKIEKAKKQFILSFNEGFDRAAKQLTKIYLKQSNFVEFMKYYEIYLLEKSTTKNEHLHNHIHSFTKKLEHNNYLDDYVIDGMKTHKKYLEQQNKILKNGKWFDKINFLTDDALTDTVLVDCVKEILRIP